MTAPRNALAVAACRFCGEPLTPLLDSGGGRAGRRWRRQRRSFCADRCRAAFWTRLRRFAWGEYLAGRVPGLAPPGAPAEAAPQAVHGSPGPEGPDPGP